MDPYFTKNEIYATGHHELHHSFNGSQVPPALFTLGLASQCVPTTILEIFRLWHLLSYFYSSMFYTALGVLSPFDPLYPVIMMLSTDP